MIEQTLEDMKDGKLKYTDPDSGKRIEYFNQGFPITTLFGYNNQLIVEKTLNNAKSFDTKKLGVEVKVEGDDIIIPKNQKLTVQRDIPGGIPKIDDAPWPGFPADLTSIMTVVATQCDGAVLIFEKMFESRLFWVDKLIEMGAQIILCDPHRAVVSGPTALKGARVSSPDIRAGMALLIAALGANGITEIHNIDQIDRGYESIDVRLNALGAKIRRVND